MNLRHFRQVPSQVSGTSSVYFEFPRKLTLAQDLSTSRFQGGRENRIRGAEKRGREGKAASKGGIIKPLVTVGD